MLENRPIIVRAVAFGADCAVLFILGQVLSVFFYDPNSYRRLKLVIDLCYWGTEVVGSQTLGKKLLKLKLSTTDNAEPSYQAKFIRFVVKHFYWLYPAIFVSEFNEMTFLPGMICLTGYLLIFFTKRRALHDLVSGTCVVKKQELQ